MESQPTRARFAPSPTGFLHIGGARTALFNWLFARATGGKFLLRIEDTDRERSLPQYTEDILESLRWLGMQWDEPEVFQSQRFSKYQEVVEQMLKQNTAYRCDCTQAQLDLVRAQCQQEKRPFRYPGTCREKNLPEGQTVIRARVPSIGETGFDDCIRGRIVFQNHDFDDWVIQRTDRSPTYNFAVVIDDYDQRISHILRGDDHINNTPKQILLYQALGFTVPRFAHLPMILGTDRTKLSKRHGAASTLEYRKMGYLPDAILNFLARLGWSHGDQEIFSIEELKTHFSLEKVGKSNAVFNPEKLNWVSGHFFKDTPAPRLAEYLNRYFKTEIGFASAVESGRFERGITIIQAKVKLIPELIDQLGCLFGNDPQYELPTKGDEQQLILERLQVSQSTLQDNAFQREALESAVRGVADARQEKLSLMAHAIRFALTGGKVSPGLFEMMEVQGKAAVLRRLDNAIRFLSSP